ncbi:MAG: flagellar hook assembly protein FlgD [Burkholderiales bacterium]|jgi:flagellar basal-body rod modification protein FlgD|nr:flagellar hook assembly protein FlgD [Burkholderiales bacterium]
MTTVNSNVLSNLVGTTSKTTADAAAAREAEARKTVDDAEDRFLKLLISQMQNQDPLNPLDNAQVTSQLAQISTVKGIEQLNDTIKDMSASLIGAQSLQAASLLGRGVLTESRVLELANGRAVGGVALGGPAANVVVSVLGAGGQVLDTLDLGAQPQGTVNFEWDGKTADGTALADGNYSFKVDAVSVGGNRVSTTPLSVSQVLSVSLENGVTVNTAGGPVALSKVRQIF